MPCPRLLVDSVRAAWEDFPSVLRDKLKQRPPNWPVYVHGDPELTFARPVKAVDIIRGLHAEVVLLAPPLPTAPPF